MRFQLNYMAILAILLGTLLQAAARAVPPAGLAREARAIIPGKTPVKGPTTGDTHSDTPTSHSTGHDGPNSYVPGASSAGSHTGKGDTKCKRADGCNNDIEPVAMDTVDGAGRFKSKAIRQNLRKVALNVYDRLWKNKPDIINRSGTNLVAALHVPGEGVFLSTIPRGDAASALLNSWQTRAPRLYDATDGNRVAQSSLSNSLHAEDGAIYQWEIRTQSAGRDRPPTLPEGSQILVFGKRGSFDRVPDVVPPCSGITGRYPPL